MATVRAAGQVVAEFEDPQEASDYADMWNSAYPPEEGYVEFLTDVPDEDDLARRFGEIWRYCLLDHGVGTRASGPCTECVAAYSISGPPDGRWNQAGADQ